METGNYYEYIFVLDIGTRFVRGLLAKRKIDYTENDRVDIMCGEIIEHETRAMQSGQIHDIEKVAATCAAVKERLENKMRELENNQDPSLKLYKTAVAVAGRNLITQKGSVKISRKSYEAITSAEVRQLELAAVQKALENINTETEYYCVGYSIVGYRIDNNDISTLLDHRGAEVEAEVLVTLLPRQVLEAMFTVTQKLGLEIDYLGLEPVAALQAAVPENLRLLNLILLDIGAGTSDIAVVAKGKVAAFGMVPMAGDVITEGLCSELLVGFNEGEQLKRSLGGLIEAQKNSPEPIIIKFRDIFGREIEKPLNEVLAKMWPLAGRVARAIADEVFNIRPSLRSANEENFAVVLVGGGSQTPSLEQEIADVMNIPRGRIGARPVGLNKSINDISGRLSGPDAATAVGIALLLTKNPGLSLTHLIVNDKRFTMLSSDRNPNVLAVLLAQGINIKNIYGRPGLAKTYTFNGVLRTLKGGSPVAATVEVNGMKADLTTAVREGDKIVFYPAVNGKDAGSMACEILEMPLPKIKYNGVDTVLPGRLTINGKEASFNDVIADRDVINYEPKSNFADFLRQQGLNPSEIGEKNTRVIVDGEDVVYKSKNYFLVINGRDSCIDDNYLIKEWDDIQFGLLDAAWKVKDFVSQPHKGKDLRVKINGEEFIFKGQQGRVLVNGAEAETESEVYDGDEIETTSGKDAEAVMVDIFRYISIDPKNNMGKRLKLLMNGQESQYSAPLVDNAEVCVLFE